jgi:UDP-N-acetylglucosamine:LPS N-acetylglucosamine transferase
VVSVGGYAGLPAAIAAVALRRPLVLAESNAVAGAANRVVSRFAASAAVAFEGTDLARAVVTGNPVRPEILAVRRSAEARTEARRALGLPGGRTVVAAFGGSLGSQRINDAVRGLVHRWAERSDLAVRHAVGRRDWPAFAADPPPGGGGSEAGAEGLVYQAVEYEDRMDLVYAAADVAVCRAGGSSCAELTVVGLAAVLVPLPRAPGDHQTANARALARAGAAVVIPDAELDADRLAAELDALLTAPGSLLAMAERSAALGRPDAADRVAALVEATAR